MYRQLEKNLLNSNTSSTCPHDMANFGLLMAEIGSGVWHPSKFQRLSRLGFVTAATSLNGGQPNFARSLAVSWVGALYVHFRGLLLPDGILPRAKFTLRPIFCVLLYCQRYCTALQQRASAKLHGMVQTMELRNFHTYIRLGGHHVGHCPHSSYSFNARVVLL